MKRTAHPHARVRTLLALAALLALLRPAAARAADAPRTDTDAPRTDTAAQPPPNPKPAKRRFPLTARLAGEAVFGVQWADVPIHPYGVEGLVGVMFDAGGLTLTPGMGVGWMGGRSEYGLRFSALTGFVELELKPRRTLHWLRIGLGLGAEQKRLQRATDGGDIVETASRGYLMLSSDVLRLEDRFAFWVGGAGRLDGEVPSFALLAGVRI